MKTEKPPADVNRLAKATSPYLIQHAANPVDWYEWGPEALEQARREDKPIFLSIGYAACHWCHVMAHESFENEEIAAVMNRLFVNIKVDREERPDLDEIYMRAAMALNRGQGGWPMSVWLTPDLKPFYAGTYFPPTQRWGRPGFSEICEHIGRAWAENRAALEADAGRLTDFVAASLNAANSDSATISLADIDRTAAILADAFDHQRGGISGGGTNKFPPSLILDLFLRTVHRQGADEHARSEMLHLAELTLDRMARGGIYDQLAGGIHRYSTDVEWLVPHFEKMLYDQALVSRSYLDAYLFTKKQFYAGIARGILDYVIADLQAPEGGFYCTRDADSEGIEGKYYVWRKDEILDSLGPTEGEFFCDHYDVSETGNWTDPHDPATPKNILRIETDIESFSARHGLAPAEAERRLAQSRAALLALRQRRVPPALDDKILAEWNGLMISSLARAGAALEEPRYIDAAKKAAAFILGKQYVGKRLQRAYRSGRTLDAAFLTDYACMIEGLIDLYEATFEPQWLEKAVELNETVIRHYYDETTGGFFFTASDHEALIARSKDYRDGATPSGNSVQLMNLLRLGTLLGEQRLGEIADRTIRCFAGDYVNRPGGAERFLAAVELALTGPIELVIVGERNDPRTQALLRSIRKAYLPNATLVSRDPGQPADNPTSFREVAPRPVNGHPAVYICKNRVCHAPVTSPEELEAALRS